MTMLIGMTTWAIGAIMAYRLSKQMHRYATIRRRLYL